MHKFLFIRKKKMLAKGHVAELTPPHTQSIWKSREEMIRAANLQHVVIISQKKKCYVFYG